MLRSHRSRWLVALGVAVAVSAVPAGAAAATTTLGEVRSNYENSTHNRLERDCGFSHPLPNDGRLSLWLFCDTPIAPPMGKATILIKGSTAAVGPFARGAVPRDLSEIPGVGRRIEQLPSRQNPQQFLPTPRGVLLPRSNNACTVDPARHQYPATWISGVARIPSTAKLLMSFTDVCVGDGTITTERFGLAEYDPATNSATLTRVFHTTQGENLPKQRMLGSPIFSRGSLFLFSFDSGHVFVARTAANPSSWQNSRSYHFSTIVTGSTVAVSAGDFSSVGQGFDLIEQTKLDNGDFTVWTAARSPAGPWTRKTTGHVSCRKAMPGDGTVNFCRALIGHPELSTTRDLLLSFFDPHTDHVWLARQAW